MIGADCFGVTLRLDSEARDFEAFVARNYRPFACPPSPRPDVDVRFGPEAGARARRAKCGMAALGMGLHLDSTSLYWENDFGFSVKVTPSIEGGFAVQGYHFDLEREADPDLRARNHQRAMRWALHFPLFRLLARRRGMELVHASALALHGRALVFCGLNKVGKSTLAAFLARQPGYRFMTDNFLLADDTAVYGFPETLRLEPGSLDRLGIAGEAGQTVYGKQHVEIGPEEICLEAAPAAFFLVSNGATLAAEPLSPERALAALSGLHAYLGEFPEQSYLSGLPLLPGVPPAHPNGKPSILADRPWFQLSLPLDWALADVKELVESCI